MQPGPWKYKGSQIVDANDDVILLQSVGLAMQMIRKSEDIAGVTAAYENSKLVQKAPELNHVVGKILDIMSDPYTNDEHRLDKIYILTEELRNAYVSEGDYNEKN